MPGQPGNVNVVPAHHYVVSFCLAAGFVEGNFDDRLSSKGNVDAVTRFVITRTFSPVLRVSTPTWATMTYPFLATPGHRINPSVCYGLRVGASGSLERVDNSTSLSSSPDSRRVPHAA